MFRNVFSSGPTPAINNDRSLTVGCFYHVLPQHKLIRCFKQLFACFKRSALCFRVYLIYIKISNLKNLSQQSVSSKRNLQEVEKFRNTGQLFLCSKNKHGRVGVQIPCIPLFVGGLPEICFYANRPNLFLIFCGWNICFSFKILSFS